MKLLKKKTKNQKPAFYMLNILASMLLNTVRNLE